MLQQKKVGIKGGIFKLIEYMYQACTKNRKGKYVLAEYEKIKRITIPLNYKHLLYMTTEVECDHSRLIDRIQSLEYIF